jgi:hypothetical protein
MKKDNTEQQKDNESHSLPFTINGNKFNSHKQFITGSEIRKIGDIPNEDKLFLAIKEPGENELIKDDKEIDLALPSVENFFSCKPSWDFTYDQKKFDWPHQFISGIELRQLKPIPDGYQIFLVVKGPWEDELISDGGKVDLARPGIEHFYSCKPNTNNG